MVIFFALDKNFLEDFSLTGGSSVNHFLPVLKTYSDRQKPSLLTKNFSDRALGAQRLGTIAKSQT
jgi:hypothetical protein